jgi:hypothetical protein
LAHQRGGGGIRRFLWSHDFLFGVPPFPAEWLVVLTAH